MTTRTGIDKEVLAQSPFFSDISERERDVIGLIMADRYLEKGEKLFSRGDEGDALALLISGELVVRTTERDEYVVDPFEVVGEMTCVDPETRSADVVATERSVVGILDRQMLRMLRDSTPEAYTAIIKSVAYRLTKRLQWVNEKVQSRYSAVSAATAIPRPSTEDPKSSAFQGRIDFRELECLDDFSTTELEMLAANASCRSYEAGSVLCREGAEADRCFIVAKGEVEVRKNVSGHMVVLGSAEKGALLGQAALIDDSPRSATLQARGSVVTLEVDRETFDKLLDRNTAVAIRFQELIAKSAIRQLRAANERLGQIPTFKDIDANEKEDVERLQKNGGFEREDTVKRFFKEVMQSSGISEDELEAVSFA